MEPQSRVPSPTFSYKVTLTQIMLKDLKKERKHVVFVEKHGSHGIITRVGRQRPLPCVKPMDRLFQKPVFL
jgi:hypothetical protein